MTVGLYPQTHPESPSEEHDIDVLKAKIDAGATRAITQFFFDTDAFLRFHEKVRKAGVTIPILPGIMPVSNFKGLQKMAGPCGIELPGWLETLFDGLDPDPETRKLLAWIGGGGDLRAARGRRLFRLPLLHPEPGRSGLRYLPGAGGS